MKAISILFLVLSTLLAALAFDADEESLAYWGLFPPDTKLV